MLQKSIIDWINNKEYFPNEISKAYSIFLIENQIEVS